MTDDETFIIFFMMEVSLFLERNKWKKDMIRSMKVFEVNAFTAKAKRSGFFNAILHRLNRTDC